MDFNVLSKEKKRSSFVANLSKMESAYLYMLIAISLSSFGSAMVFPNEPLGPLHHHSVKIALCSRRRSADVPVSATGFSDCLGPGITSVPICTDVCAWKSKVT